jgi:hypothetical protein
MIILSGLEDHLSSHCCKEKDQPDNTCCGYSNLQVAPSIASFAEYTRPLLDHLLHSKLRHWERPLRALAAKALAALVPAAPQLLATEALTTLLPLVTSDVLEVRAGAVMGLAEVLPALAAAGVNELNCEQDKLQEEGLAQRVPRVLVLLKEGGFYRGKGGEIMREVAARYVEQLSNAVRPLGAATQCAGKNLPEGECGGGLTNTCGRGGSSLSTSEPKVDTQQQQEQEQGDQQQLELPLDQAYHKAALDLIKDCLGQPLEGARSSGVAALKAYAQAHCTESWPRDELLQIVSCCCERLRSGNVDHRRGAAAALGALPAELIGGWERDIVANLCAATQVRLP